MNMQALLAQRRNEILAMCERYGGKRVRLFGSCARGDNKANSDIDILVDFSEANLKGFKYFGTIEGLHEDLEKLLGVKVDVVDESGLRHRIKNDVLSEARAL